MLSAIGQSSIRVDSSFGVNGMALTVINGGTPTHVAFQDDGKIVFAGTMFNNQVFVGRFTADGRVDSSFASNGLFTLTIGSFGRAVKRLEVTTEGRIVCVFEYSRNPGAGLVMLRLLPDGQPDTELAPGGYVSNNISDLANVGTPAVLREAAGSYLTGNTVAHFNGAQFEYTGVLHRLGADGRIDSTFGTNGRLRLDSIRNIRGVQALERTPQLDLIVAGLADSGAFENNVVVYKTNAAGVPDPSFGEGGKVKIRQYTPQGYRCGPQMINLAVLPDGKIFIDNILVYGQFRYRGFIRLLPDGRLDESFGEGGRMVEPAGFGAQGYDQLRQLPDGRFVNLGKLGPSSSPEVISHRGDGTIDSTVYFDGPFGRYYGYLQFDYSVTAQTGLGGMALAPAGDALYAGLNIADGNSLFCGLVKLSVDPDPAAAGPHVETHNLRLYPNPASGHLYLDSDIPVVPGSIRLYSIDGRELPVRITGTPSSPTQLLLDELPGGLYFLQAIPVGKAPVSKRLVISR